MNEKFKALLIDLAKYIKNNPKMADAINTIIHDDGVIAIVQKYNFGVADILKFVLEFKKNKAVMAEILTLALKKED